MPYKRFTHKPYGTKKGKTTKKNYLEHNSQSLQKNYRGERSLLQRKTAKTMLELRVYLERIRNSMHEPIEDRHADCQRKEDTARQIVEKENGPRIVKLL